MTPPRWIIPLESGEIVPGRPALVVTVGDDMTIHIDDQRDPIPRRLKPLSPLAACQLGQALQDAAAWCGQERARREARKR